MPVTAIVLAAGEGTRMKSHHPKVMVVQRFPAESGTYS